MGTPCNNGDGSEMNHGTLSHVGILQQKVNDLFSAESERWDRLYSKHDVFSVIIQDRHLLALTMVDVIRLPPGARVLDVGCGAGFTSIALAERGYQVDALDSVQAMITLVQKRSVEVGVSDRVRPVLGDINKLPCGDRTFAAVIALGVAPWLPDLRRALSEITRVLSPGGHLIISGDNPWRIGDLIDPALNPVLRPLKRAVGSTLARVGLRAPSSLPPLRRYTRRSVFRLLREAGLRPLTYKSFGFGPITFLRRPILSDDLGVRIHRIVQLRCDRGRSLLGHVASQYLVLARLGETAVEGFKRI